MQAISNRLDELIAERKAREEMVRIRSEVFKDVCYGSALGGLGVLCALTLI